jgi:hypothetical protein
LQDPECRASLRIARSRWPPADSHELLPPLDLAVEIAKVGINIVDTGEINDREHHDGLYGIIAACANRMAQLYYEA